MSTTQVNSITIVDKKSPYLKLPLPNSQNNLIDDVTRILESFNIIDTNAKEIAEEIKKHFEAIQGIENALTEQERIAKERALTTNENFESVNTSLLNLSANIENAQNSANSGISKAENAQATANDAATKAEQAQEVADSGISKANTAQSRADSAFSRGSTALTEAQKATGKAYVTATNNSSYIKFSNGIIMQWGSVTAVGAGAVVTFPVSMTTTSYSVVVSLSNVTSNGEYGTSVSSRTTTNMKVFTPHSGSRPATWFIIGK